jgi:hypothetical protein
LAFNYIYNLKEVSKLVIGVTSVQKLNNLISKKDSVVNLNQLNNIQNSFQKDFKYEQNILGKFL